MSETLLSEENISNKNNNRRKQIKDVQSIHDNRHIYINKVGIRNVKYPIRIMNGDKILQNTIANVDMFVFLPDSQKGTHMSRFVEILNNHEKMDIFHPKEILTEIKEKLNTIEAYIELSFPYFVEKKAPVTGKKSLMDYEVILKSSINKENFIDTILTIEIPVTTLCPCSKEISEFGAHSQRGIVTLSIRHSGDINVDDMINLVEKSASCELYPLLKREDEKYVTEKAYLNPVFVEDLARNIALQIEQIESIFYFRCEVENEESIHKHNAYAMIERDYR